MNTLLAVAAALAAPVLSQAPGDREIVKVNGTPIRQSEVVERLWRQYGPETLEALVNELLLRQAVAADKIKAEPAQIEARILRLRQRMAPDPKAFEAQLQQMGKTMDGLRAEIEEQLKFERMIVARKKLSVSEADVKKAFEAHKAELADPEAVQLRHIMVATKPEADDIVAQIKAGADFRKLAAEKSLAPTGKLNGGEYGWVPKGQLPAEVDKTAFSMKEGEVKIVASDKGQHILQVLAKRAASPAEYAKVKDDLREAVLQDKIRAALPGVVKELREKAEIKPHAQ